MRPILRVFLLLPTLLTLAPPLLAQEDAFPFPYTIDDFDNGLRLVTVPTAFPGIVCVHIVVSVGSRQEIEPGKSGFAHFFEHMMFRGTKNMTAEQRAATFKQAGADRNAYTTDDYTDYHTTVPSEELETVLRLEADRFKNLEYSEKAFRTEAMAVLGEYNKNAQNPVGKLFEVMRETAFERHTYEHTTMGFLRDIRAMPEQFDYSRRFFARFYRPEYATIVVVGDTSRAETKALVERYWSDWERGSYVADIAPEPAQTGPLSCHVEWPSPTQPWVAVAFKGPAFSTTRPDMATLDVISELAFSANSEIYKKLFVRERVVDALFSYQPDHTDPYLLMVLARVREPKDWAHVRDEILATFESLKTNLVDADRLAAVKANLRYGFASGLDSSEAIAGALAGYIARTRTPDSINRVYSMYDAVTPEAVLDAARKYYVASGRTIATLSHEPLPDAPAQGDAVRAAGRTVLRPSSSPLVTFRILFETGAAVDPAGKEGLAYLTAQLLTNGATASRSYEEILEELYPMAASVGASVDKEMTVFTGTVHRDNLDRYYALLKEMLTEPGFDEEDLERIKANTISYLDVGLRRSNDEELGKEVLLGEIFRDHPYRHHDAGAIEAIRGITIEDVEEFYRTRYIVFGMHIGLAGGYPEGFPEKVENELSWHFLPGEVMDASRMPLGVRAEIPAPEAIVRNRMKIVEKTTSATGIHIGFPIEVTRSHPDWIALWLVRSYFGEHRSENSYLYQRLREIRGLNYGDYAYIEYFPNGGGQFQPDPNLARQHQVFQIWIRPVPHENGPFTLKAAYYELRKLVHDGMGKEQFEATRRFLAKYAPLLVATQDRQLGYALDAEWYGTGDFVSFVRRGLDRLTLDDVNRAIRKHLRADRLQFVVVTEDAQAFKDAILGSAPTPISYQTPPAREILAEDAIIDKLRIPLRPDDVTIVPVAEVFVR